VSDPPSGARTEAEQDTASKATLWHNRDFMLLWSGNTLSEFGSQISTVALPLLVLSLTGSPTQAGIVGFARSISYPLSAVPAGVLVDRLNRRTILVVCSVGRAVTLASVPVVLALGRPPTVHLALVAFVDTVLFCCADIAERGALGQLVPRAQLASAVALNEARASGAVVSGPPLGGLLFGASRSLPFIADTASYVGAIAAFRGIRTPMQRERDHRSSTREDLFEGARWLWRQPFLRFGALLFAASNPLFVGVELLAILLARHHGASPDEIGVMFLLIGAGGLAGAALANPLRARLAARTAILSEQWLVVALVPVLLLAHSALALGLVIGTMMSLSPLTVSIIIGHRLALTPDDLQGRVQASASVIASSIGWVGPLAVGILFQQAGPDATVLVAAGWALLTALGTALAPSGRLVPPVTD
jgi:MFS family permease